MTTTKATEQAENLRSLISDHLTSMYACTRVWEAWGVGTMTEDDFTPARETDFVEDLARAIEAAALTTPPAAPAERIRQYGPEGNLEEYLPPDEPVEKREPDDVIKDLQRQLILSFAEAERLRERIEAARRAYTEALAEARKPRMKTTLERQQWDDGYKNGVEACASVVWAALTTRRPRAEQQ